LSWRWYNDIPVLNGFYQFKTEYRGITFQDSFNLEINFPPDYPDNLPHVKELDYKIPNIFHRFTNGDFCLCTPCEQWLIFSKKPTLENYITNLVNPYLLSWLWFQRFNKMPWGERKHGYIGLIESYRDLLRLTDIRHTIYFMIEFVKNELHHKKNCPCGSGRLFRKCHGNIVHKYENSLPQGQLINDFLFILGGLHEEYFN
jgi:hypothetical protein